MPRLLTAWLFPIWILCLWALPLDGAISASPSAKIKTETTAASTTTTTNTRNRPTKLQQDRFYVRCVVLGASSTVETSASAAAFPVVPLDGDFLVPAKVKQHEYYQCTILRLLPAPTANLWKTLWKRKPTIYLQLQPTKGTRLPFDIAALRDADAVDTLNAERILEALSLDSLDVIPAAWDARDSGPSPDAGPSREPGSFPRGPHYRHAGSPYRGDDERPPSSSSSSSSSSPPSSSPSDPSRFHPTYFRIPVEASHRILRRLNAQPDRSVPEKATLLHLYNFPVLMRENYEPEAWRWIFYVKDGNLPWPFHRKSRAIRSDSFEIASAQAEESIGTSVSSDIRRAMLDIESNARNPSREHPTFPKSVETAVAAYVAGLAEHLPRLIPILHKALEIATENQVEQAFNSIWDRFILAECELAKDDPMIMIDAITRSLLYAVENDVQFALNKMTEHFPEILNVAFLRFTERERLDMLTKIHQLNDQVDVNYNGGAPIVAATRTGNMEIVKTLLSYGADMSSRNGLVLALAVQLDHGEVLQFYLQQYVEFDLLAVRSGQPRHPYNFQSTHVSIAMREAVRLHRYAMVEAMLPVFRDTWDAMSREDRRRNPMDSVLQQYNLDANAYFLGDLLAITAKTCDARMVQSILKLESLPEEPIVVPVRRVHFQPSFPTRSMIFDEEVDDSMDDRLSQLSEDAFSDDFASESISDINTVEEQQLLEYILSAEPQPYSTDDHMLAVMNEDKRFLDNPIQVVESTQIIDEGYRWISVAINISLPAFAKYGCRALVQFALKKEGDTAIKLGGFADSYQAALSNRQTQVAQDLLAFGGLGTPCKAMALHADMLSRSMRTSFFERCSKAWHMIAAEILTTKPFEPSMGPVLFDLMARRRVVSIRMLERSIQNRNMPAAILIWAHLQPQTDIYLVRKAILSGETTLVTVIRNVDGTIFAKTGMMKLFIEQCDMSLFDEVYSGTIALKNFPLKKLMYLAKYATQHRCIGALHRFLGEVDVHEVGEALMTIAARVGDLEILRVLRARGVTWIATIDRTIEELIESKSWETLRYLMTEHKRVRNIVARMILEQRKERMHWVPDADWDDVEVVLEVPQSSAVDAGRTRSMVSQSAKEQNPSFGSSLAAKVQHSTRVQLASKVQQGSRQELALRPLDKMELTWHPLVPILRLYSSVEDFWQAVEDMESRSRYGKQESPTIPDPGLYSLTFFHLPSARARGPRPSRKLKQYDYSPNPSDFHAVQMELDDVEFRNRLQFFVDSDDSPADGNGTTQEYLERLDGRYFLEKMERASAE